MKFLLAFISFFLLHSESYCQEIMSYTIEGIPYTNYSVIKNDDISAIAAKYGLTTAAILQHNRLQPNAVLQEGRQLKISLEGAIKPACNGAGCIKVFYTVQQSEGLYRIGKNYGNLKVPQLKQLNNLKSESVSVGQKLLVGYITTDPITDKKNVDSIKIPDASIVRDTASPKPAQMQQPVVAESKMPGTKTIAVNEHTKATTHKKDAVDTMKLVYNGNGFFEEQYKETGTEVTLAGAFFKSESGWSDGKFYILVDGIATGTVIKIISADPAKFIYAKVLGGLPKLKGNDNARFRVSNAAAVALGIRSEDVFQLIIRY